MKNFVLLLIFFVLSSCSSTPSQDDPTQNLISLITSNIGYHDYQNAKKILNESSLARSEMTYYIEKEAYSNKFTKVTYSLADMNLYLDDLIDAKKAIELGCGIRKASDKDSNEQAMSLQELEGLFKEKEYYARCVSKRGSDEKIEKAFTDARLAINRHQWEYFSQKSSFDGKNTGYIFGLINIGYCAGVKRSLRRTTKEIFECFLNDEEKKAYQALKITEELLMAARNEMKKNEKSEYEIQVSKDNADGTTILKDYCLNVRALNAVSKDLAQEQKIAKEVGMVNKNKLYEIGQAIVIFKDAIKQKSEAYKKIVGQNLSYSKCTNAQ